MITIALTGAGVVPKSEAIARAAGQLVVAPAILILAISTLADTTVADLGTIPFAIHAPKHHLAGVEAFAVTSLLVAIFDVGLPYVPEITGAVVAGFLCPGTFGIPVSLNPAFTALTALLTADMRGSLPSLAGTLLAGAAYGSLRLRTQMAAPAKSKED
eukprot:CAMPEP_0119430012 /NCGR_PEP_ID=MMETSP1335-20130426/43296_1 /TAXON_ID=259385 /ORGANISM="Chrysoculter rhomboideus, Strain RCC1486" /LENGTH=157 /DNA_ID=CAMNT_0007455757 /DNA_START=138 /DNA_END=611 /DNA_ORIENTATION=-